MAARFPARLHVLLASEAPVGVVLRRGPSKSVCSIPWNRKKDTFELGQWLRGRIYERRADISPDGRYLIYFAMNGKWTSETKGSWTAVSRVPWLKALVLLGKGDCWNGGGLFTSNSQYWVNDGYGHFPIRVSGEVQRDRRFQPVGQCGAECLSVYYPRLQRNGWVLQNSVQCRAIGNKDYMRIFISWSGERSRAIAETLREWLPYVLPAAEPWMSATDVDRGSRWSLEISEQLDKANVGIICLTPENVDASWILFEAGALSKALSQSLVCTYLFQLRPADVKGPLAQFQATRADKHETNKMLASMNRALGSAALSGERLNKMFEVWWPELDRKLETLSKEESKGAVPHRSDRDILEEILSLQRRNDVKAFAPEVTALILDGLRASGRLNARDLRPTSGVSKKTRANDAVLVVDTHPLLGTTGEVIRVSYPLFGTVSDLLDELYGYVSDAVPVASFGHRWALRDVNSGKQFTEMGRTWARQNLHRDKDSRLLDDVGIRPGMQFEAIPLSSPQ